MSHSTMPQPSLTGEGIAFSVRVDSLNRACFITKDALQELSRLKTKDSAQVSMMEIFHAFEPTINGVARRLVFAKVPGTPLRLGANTFASPPHVA